jgi:hydroxymethylbilane synthase
MKKLCPDCIIKPIRGNVPRRIELAEEGELDGVILAYAGLKRLGMQKKASVVFRKEQMLCAPAQGALAVQTRKGDKDTVKIVSSINEEETNLCTAAERQILVSTGCGCHAPVGAFAQISGNDIAISAFISDLDVENFIRYTLTGKKDNAVDIAKHLAGKLLDNGGSEILENLENNNHSPLF